MGISLSGLGSGFDWQSMIDQLKQVENQRLVPLSTRKTEQQKRLSAWETLGSKLSTLKTVVADLKSSGAFDVHKASLTSSSSSVSADSILSISSSAGAGKGRFDIIVQEMAKAEKIQSNSVASQSTALGWTGTLTLGSSGTEINLDAGWNLQEVQNAINEKNSGPSATGVSASILQVADSDFRLILTSDKTGVTGAQLVDAANDYFQDTPLQQGRNALLTIDGIPITRESNSIDDILAGVTLTIRGESPGTSLTLAVEKDNEAVNSKVQSFVDAYNGVLDYFSTQMSYSAESKTTGGVLFGDNTFKAIKSNLQSILGNAGLANVGITVGDDNRLSLDASKLQGALASSAAGSIETFNTVARDLDSALDNLTDSTGGTLPGKQKSIQDMIAGIDKKMTATQTLIDRRMETLTKQFIALDSAMSTMSSQSQWLATQLAALS